MNINFGLLDTGMPARIANSFYEGQQEQSRNALLAAQLKAAQNQDALAQYQLSTARRGDEAQNALSEAYRNAYNPQTGAIDESGLMSSLASRGVGYKIPEIQAQLLKAKSDRAALMKAQADAAAAIIKHGRDLLPSIKDQASYDVWRAGMIKELPQLGQFIPPQFSPDVKVGLMLNADKALEKHFATQDLGGTTRVIAIPKYGSGPAEVIPGSEAMKTMSPEAIAANQRGWADIATKKEANQVTREVNSAKRTQDVEMKLADDYRMESKGFAETSTAMKKVLGALKTADKNPGSALAAGTAFMKILDPNSVVRETELGMALNASGWFDRATNLANTLQSGRIMTPTQVKNLEATANQLFEDAKEAQSQVDSAYSERAKSYGANPDNVIVNRGQKSVKEKPSLTPKNKQGWSLMVDANGNRAYVSPDGKQFEEVE